MWPDITHISVSPFNLVLRSVVVFIFVLILLRLSGKRQVGQMSAPELIAIMLISNAVQNSMNAGDNSLVGGLLSAAVLIVMTWLISELTFRNNFFRTIFEGSPTILVHKGKMLEKNLRRERITHSELKTLLRKQGVHFVHEIDTAILESDGTLSLMRTSEVVQGERAVPR